MPDSGAVYVVGTCDTKGTELEYVAALLRSLGVPVVTVDVSVQNVDLGTTDISSREVWSHHPTLPAETPAELDRGLAVSAMSIGLTTLIRSQHREGRVAGILGIGGSGGTALIAPAMRELPIGLPKLMVSTVASGNTAPYVGCTDLMMLYSVVDIAGINTVSRLVLANAAHAMAGMVSHGIPPVAVRPAVGITMFGVTTPCVNRVRGGLESRGFDPLVFHATGTGGQAMERLLQHGQLAAIIDLTTTEVADELMEGVFSAGPHRLEAIAQSELPCILSVGAMDMVNFGALDTVPLQYKDRRLHVHNAQVTLMRTTVDENRRCAEFIASKLQDAQGRIAILLPENGVSALDAPGKPFYDPDADQMLFRTLETLLPPTSKRRIERLPWHINDPEFADRVLQVFDELTRVDG
jgi:uncharacterized protein (UPF0261 family)